MSTPAIAIPTSPTTASPSSNLPVSPKVIYGAAGVAAVAAMGLAYKYFAPSPASKKKGACCGGKVAKASKIDMTKVKTSADLPIVDLSRFLNKTNEAEWREDCETISELLHEYGILIIKDPRVAEKENDTFLDLLEKYYEQPEEVREKDVRKELHYQIGVTPSGVEKARDHCARVAKLEESERPLTICPPEKDPKSRFFWRMGETPAKTDFPALNAPPVVPAAFPEWTETMNRWGSLMLESVSTVAEMAAIGFGLPSQQFVSMMKFAPHLLAPTASDLAKDGALHTVFANYHYDLNFLTIHGRSRFPGLFVWTRHGKKLQVKVPPNCLLVQAGKQFEWLTGGEVLAGFHEVVVIEDTLKAVEKANNEKRSLWRISSTLFAHIASDQTLEPVGQFSTPSSLATYPPIKAGNQVQKELELIKLASE